MSSFSLHYKRETAYGSGSCPFIIQYSSNPAYMCVSARTNGLHGYALVVFCFTVKVNFAVHVAFVLKVALTVPK